MSERWSVYGLYAGEGGGFFYVGSTANPGKRLRDHLSAARTGKTDSTAYKRVRVLLQTGVTPGLAVLEVHPTKVAALLREEEITRCWKECGVGLVNEAFGYKPSEVLRAKWSAVQTESQSRPGVKARVLAGKRGAGLRCDNTSGHKGIAWHQRLGKYRVRINVAKRGIHLGVFGTLDQAVAARRAAERKYWGMESNQNV
jgi:predicted GIY-YIG superfamily endonuclease